MSPLTDPGENTPKRDLSYPINQPPINSIRSAGQMFSVQFFDLNGDSALKVFLNFGGKPTLQREELFAKLKSMFAKEVCDP